MTTNSTPDARAHVAAWITEERRLYADPKWDEANGELHERDVASGDWQSFMRSYEMRAAGAGLDTEYGRQQLGKLIVTGLHYLESAVGGHGPMPLPGVPSGEIEEWAKPKADCRHASFSIESWQNPNPFCNDCGEALSAVPTSGYLHKRNPEVVPTPDGIVTVDNGQATLFSQPEEGDDDFGLQA